MKIRITRKQLKKLLSVVGATVLLGTFLAKETRKDKLKELADSIDAGENSYIIREQNRTMFAELKRFEAEFVEFRKHPTRPKPDLSGFGGGSGGGWVGPGEVDSEVLNSIADHWRENQEILGNVVQLANKLSTPSGSDLLDLGPINADNEHLKTELVSITGENDFLRKIAPKLAHEELVEKADSLNKQIYALFDVMDRVNSGTDHLNRIILDDAEREHRSDERMYLVWTQRFYALYLVGWLITVAGILIGEDKEDNQIESLVDET
jgi:hypothetical protein